MSECSRMKPGPTITSVLYLFRPTHAVESHKMKLSEMKTNAELIAEEANRDPVFRAEWERTEFARAVARYVVGFRVRKDMSQKELAGLLGITQPQVSRLERGDVNPTFETLVRLVSVVGEELTIDIRPAGTNPKLVTKKARDGSLASYETSGTGVLVTAAA